MKNVLLFATLMLITVLAEAGVYKCETSAGLVYSERPCPKDAKEHDFRMVKPTESVSRETSGDSAKLMQQMNSESKARKLNDEKKREAAAEDAARDRSMKCDQAKQKLGMYKQPMRIYSKDQNGERTYVEDDARASIIEDLKKEVESNCD